MKNRPRPNTAFTNLFSEDAPQRGTSREQRLPFRSQISVDRHCLRARLLNGSPTLDGVSTVLPAGATASLETRGGLGASALATVQPTATFPATGRRPAGPTGPPRASPTPARIRESARTVAILQPTQARRSTFSRSHSPPPARLAAQPSCSPRLHHAFGRRHDAAADGLAPNRARRHRSTPRRAMPPRGRPMSHFRQCSSRRA